MHTIPHWARARERVVVRQGSKSSNTLGGTEVPEPGVVVQEGSSITHVSTSTRLTAPSRHNELLLHNVAYYK